jgi:hypothetical protein
MMLNPAKWSFTVSWNAASTIAARPARLLQQHQILAAGSGLVSSIQETMENGWGGVDSVVLFGLGLFMGPLVPADWAATDTTRESGRVRRQSGIGHPRPVSGAKGQ